MNTNILTLLLIPALGLGCHRRQEATQAPVPPPPATLQLPEAIKARWQGATFTVQTGAEGPARTFRVQVGQTAPIPGTGLTLQLGALVPDFTMGEGVITSRTAEATNPAARVRISGSGREPFSGWLFASFPEAHPFEDPRYRVLLQGLVPAGDRS